MLDFFMELWANMFFRICSAVIILINLCLWYVAFETKSLFQDDKMAILNYNVDFGIKLYDSAGKIFYLPVLGLIFLALNVFLLFVLRKNTRDKKYFRYLVMSFTLFLQIILFISILTLYLVNFNQ